MKRRHSNFWQSAHFLFKKQHCSILKMMKQYLKPRVGTIYFSLSFFGLCPKVLIGIMETGLTNTMMMGGGLAGWSLYQWTSLSV